MAHARDQMSGLQNLNAVLHAGDTLVVVTRRDATFAGAGASGTDVLLDVGGDLTVASRQDVGHGASRSSNIGGSVVIGLGSSPSSVSVSGGLGKGSSDHGWVNDQTAIVAREMLDARVEGHTQIDGAVIASLAGDLTLDTGTLGFSDFHDHDRGSSWSVQAGFNSNAVGGVLKGASVSGHMAEYEREQETRATVGDGEIIIRDAENQTQDVAALNRDLDKAQEITRDERSGVEFYASTSAVEEIGSGFQGIRQNLENTANSLARFDRTVAEAASTVDLAGKTLIEAAQAVTEGLLGRSQLAPESARRIGDVLDALASKNLSLDAVLSCGGGKQGFNLFDLLIPSAYAQASGCTYVGADNKEYQLTAEEREKCLQILAGTLQKQLDEAAASGKPLKETLGISDVAAYMRKLDQQLGVGDKPLSEVVGLGAELVNELTRAAVYKAGGAEALEAYDTVAWAFATGAALAKEQFDAWATSFGKENGYTDQQIADLKYVGTAVLAIGQAAVGSHGRTISFTRDTASSAYANMRGNGGHAMRHLIDEGIIPNSGSLVSIKEIFELKTSSILTDPTMTFDWRLGGTATKAFVGKLDDKPVVMFVAKEGPYQGNVLSAIVPDANQIAQWGIR